MLIRDEATCGAEYLTLKGRCAVRRWYRISRCRGMSIADARWVVGRMAHASSMGSFWNGAA